MKVIATYRPIAVSRAYYARGRNSLSYVNGLYRDAGMAPITAVENFSTVTNATPGKSWHNYGLGVDFVPIVNGNIDWKYNPEDPADHYDEIKALAEAEGMQWGGDNRTFKDYPHVEWHPGFTIAQAMDYAAHNGYHSWLPIVKLKPPVANNVLRYGVDSTRWYGQHDGSIRDRVTGKTLYLTQIIKILNERNT